MLTNRAPFSCLLLLIPVVLCAQEPQKEPVDFYTTDGTRVGISREEFKKHLLKSIKDASYDSDKLYELLVTALENEYYEEALNAVSLLEKIDTDPERAAAIRVAALRRLGRNGEAVNFLKKYFDTHEETVSLLTNLGQAYYGIGEIENAIIPLKKALRVDPNFEAAFQMLAAIRYEQEGDNGRIAMEDEYSKDDRSFRAPLLKAARALRQNNLSDAKSIYESLLKRFPNEQDVLMGITGGLGEAGYAADAIALVAPIYNPKKHGFSAGLNLLAAYNETKQPQAGKQLITQLRLLHRYDIKGILKEYETVFDAM